jgi:pimeloyl-ACP methyl ester carboxylesterase
MQKIFTVLLALLFTGFGLTFAQKQSKTIQIDGKSQYYQLTGIENRKLGQPLIIIESDLGANLEPWHRVITELPENTPVFAYDRAGNGQSEAFDEIPTPANRTRQLKSLLDKLNLAPPYILVGHGWGGILIKDFALAHQKDIEAMIYLDPKDRSTSKEKMIEIFDREGMEGEKIATDYFRMRMEGFQNVPAGVRAEAEVLLDFSEGKTSNSKLYDFPEVPSVIFVGGKYVGYMENPMSAPLEKDFQEILNVMQKNRIADFTEQILAIKNSELVLISDYMHYLHLQEPEKVGSAILSKYYGKPSEKIAVASEKYSAEEFEEYLDGLLSYFPEEKLTEAIINMHGYDQLRRDKPEHALVLFRHNLVRFPESANVYDSMGDGLVALGKTKDAVPYFEKAVELGEMSRHRDLGLFKKNLASAKEGK